MISPPRLGYIRDIMWTELHIAIFIDDFENLINFLLDNFLPAVCILFAYRIWKSTMIQPAPSSRSFFSLLLNGTFLSFLEKRRLRVFLSASPMDKSSSRPDKYNIIGSCRDVILCNDDSTKNSGP